MGACILARSTLVERCGGGGGGKGYHFSSVDITVQQLDIYESTRASCSMSGRGPQFMSGVLAIHGNSQDIIGINHGPALKIPRPVAWGNRCLVLCQSRRSNARKTSAASLRYMCRQAYRPAVVYMLGWSTWSTSLRLQCWVQWQRQPYHVLAADISYGPFATLLSRGKPACGELWAPNRQSRL